MSQIAEDTFVTSLHCETTWHAFMTSGLYGYQSPRCFMVFIYLTSPNCSTKSLFCWFLGEASAQPPMLLYQESARWCSRGSSQCPQTALGFCSGPLPCLRHPTRSKQIITAEKSGVGGRGQMSERKLCISDMVRTQSLTQSLWISKAGMLVQSWDWFCCIPFPPDCLRRAYYDNLGRTMLLERPGTVEVVFHVIDTNPH